MKIGRHTFAILSLLLGVAGIGRAQTSYFCDFEDPSERALWTLNPMKSTDTPADYDQVWYDSVPGQCGASGNYGLYISSDEGKTNSYSGAHTSYISAYRDVDLAAGTYTIRFDWKLMGKSTDKIVVAWVPRTNKCNGNKNTADQNPTFTGGVDITNGRTLNQSSAWTSFSKTITIPANLTQGRLVFYFCAKSGGKSNPAAAIDNIEIVQGSCPAPTNLTYDPSTGLSWNGSGNYYDIRYYSYQAGVWHSINNHLGKSVHLNLQEEGYIYFYVRQVCDSANNIHSDWVSIGKFTYISGLRCIEYLDLGKGGESSAAGQCYESNYAGYTNNPLQNGEGVDPADPSQYRSANAEHVLHTDPNEIDPNTTTAGGLKTVPDGEIASVRLGAYTGSGNSSRVVYKYRVQPGISDLLILKYAPVLLSGGHSEVENPRFTLEILDGNGQVLDSRCTQADFKAGFGDTQKWHQEGDLFWSDWQTITVSLRNYVNQTLTIRLTSIRCTYDTHFAYAYFTMGCKSGDFEGIACGDFSVDKFTAPEGFHYRWRKASDPTQRVLGEDQVFKIDLLDTAIYTVDMISLMDPECYYTLTANPNPRFPISNLRVAKIAQKDCGYEVEFRNDAYVAYINRRDTTLHTRSNEPIDGIYWDFGDGQTKFTTDTIIKHTYSGHGGTITAKCVVSMNDGVCVTKTDSVVFGLADLYEPGKHYNQHMCEGQSYRLPSGEMVTSDTTVYLSSTGGRYHCETTDTLSVYFHPSSSDTVRTIICEGGYIDFEGHRFTESVIFDTVLRNQYNCDSARRLELTVVPSIHFMTADTVRFCDDETDLAFHVTVDAGIYGGMVILPDPEAIAAGFQPRYEFPEPELAYILSPTDYTYVVHPDSLIRPGIYRFRMEPLSERCPAEAQPTMVMMRYSSQVLYQKAGYIVLYNPQYNYAGYEFSRYRWYRNGVLLPDTKSYIQPTAADYKALYHVELTRSDDGSVMESCPFEYTGVFTPHAQEPAASPARIAPTCLAPGRPMSISGEGMVRVLTPLGNVVSTAEVHAEEPIQLAAPRKHGVYFVVIGDESFRVLVQ